MAYNVQWYPHRADMCRKQAEERALRRLKESPLLDSIFLYRFTECTYASLDPYKYEWGNDDDYDFVTHVELQAFVAKKTPCGWSIEADNSNRRRFISESARKKFALPTIEDALQSYVARKKKQASIYEARAKKARWCINQALGKTFILPLSA